MVVTSVLLWVQGWGQRLDGLLWNQGPLLEEGGAARAPWRLLAASLAWGTLPENAEGLLRAWRLQTAGTICN